MGSALARHADDETIWQTIDNKAWDPDWQEVICYVVGRMSEGDFCAVNRLLTTLADSRFDDISRHRLRLAAMCLIDISRHCRVDVASSLEHITNALMATKGSSTNGYNVDRPFAAVAHLDPSYNGKSLIAWLVDLLSGSLQDWRMATAYLKRMGAAAAKPVLIVWLKTMLVDESNEWTSRSALAVLVCIREAAETMSVVPVLTHLLRHGSCVMRSRALDYLQALGEHCLTHEVVISLLQDEDLSAAIGAAWIVARFPDRFGTERVLQLLRRQRIAVEQMELSQRVAVDSYAIDRALVSTLNQPSAQLWLARLLASTDPNETNSALSLLTHWKYERLVVRSSELLAVLANYLTGGDLRRSAALDALSALGSAAATPAVLSTIPSLIYDDQSSEGAIALVMRLGPSALTPEIIHACSVVCAIHRAYIQDPDQRVSTYAKELIWKAGLISGDESVEFMIDSVVQSCEGINDTRMFYPTDEYTKLFYPGQYSLLARRGAIVFHHFGGSIPFGIDFYIRELCRRSEVSLLLQDISRLLVADDVILRWFGAVALQGVGERIAEMPSLRLLVSELLVDSCRAIRIAALDAITATASARVSTNTCEHFCNILAQADGKETLAVLRAIRAIGLDASSPAVLRRLNSLVMYAEEDIREAAAEALIAFGPMALSPKLVRFIGDSLFDERSYASATAARILNAMEARGARFFRLEDHRLEVRLVGELAYPVRSMEHPVR